MLSDTLAIFIQDMIQLVEKPTLTYYQDLIKLFDKFIYTGFVIPINSTTEIADNVIAEFDSGILTSIEHIFINYMKEYLSKIPTKYTVNFNVNSINFNNYYNFLINNKITLSESVILFCNVIYNWIKSGYVTIEDNNEIQTIQFT